MNIYSGLATTRSLKCEEDMDIQHQVPYMIKPMTFSFAIISRRQGFPGGSVVKNSPASVGSVGSSLVQEDLLEKDMATHSSILAWKTP